MPLRLIKTSKKYSNWGNQIACWMMLTTDVDDSGWGFAPPHWQFDINNVIVAREDGQDLSVNEVMNLFGFCADFLDVVQNAAEVGTKAAKLRAMQFLTPENYQKKTKEYSGQT
jgi:hypothetical protein